MGRTPQCDLPREEAAVSGALLAPATKKRGSAGSLASASRPRQVRAGFSDGVQWLMWEWSQRMMRDNEVLAGKAAGVE